MPDTQISDALGLIDGGLQLLLAAVHADDPKREMLVRVGDLLRDVRSLEAALSGYVVVPRAVPHGFKTGDRVRHTGRDEVGAVAILDNGNVQVTFDNPNPRGGKSIGEYDANWFKIYPRGLVAEGEAAE